MVHRIRAEHQGNPRKQTVSVREISNIRVDLPEARGDRSAHPPDIDPPIIPRRLRLTREMYRSMCRLPCHSNRNWELCKTH